MDVDAPNILKRCSSAPLINEDVSTAVTSPTANAAPSFRNTCYMSMFSNSNLHRTRRFSASFSPLVTSPNSFMPRHNPRVSQLRQEESADVTNTREVAHEREIHCTMQMGQSCEDLTLMTTGHSGSPAPMSPTRINRFSPGVSPSPTRKYTTRRSLSPTIALRASSFSPVSRPSILMPAKRRFDEADSPSGKRMCTSDRLTPSTPGTPDSDSPLECTFRPVSPRAQPMHETHQGNHKPPNPS